MKKPSENHLVCPFAHFVTVAKIRVDGECADVVLWADVGDRRRWHLMRIDGPPELITKVWHQNRAELVIAGAVVRPLVRGRTREPGVLHVDPRLVRATIETLESARRRLAAA